MTFNAIETGARTGRKVFLYTWARGVKVWRYTGADHEIVIDSARYTASPIDHDEPEQGPDINRLSLQVRVPMLHPIALMFRAQAPVDSIVVTISEYHQGDPDQEVRPVWSGRIVTVGWDIPDGEATITHAPTYTSLGRTGLRRRCQKNCPLVLYGLACGASRDGFELQTIVEGMAGYELTAPGIADKPDGYFDGGYIQYEVEGGVIERRGIRANIGGSLLLTHVPAGLGPGTPVSIYPGCDHTVGPNGCLKFDNLPRYGGFPNFARKNPFGSDPVY